MNDKDAASAFLDSFANQMKADLPGPGEYTLVMFCEEMEKRGLSITRNSAIRRLKDWVVRDGRTPEGKPVKIFKAPVAGFGEPSVNSEK